MVEILAKITKERSADITHKGFTFGHQIPSQRIHPLIKPNLDSVFIIAEIKRSSPSAGLIDPISSPKDLALSYLNGGAGAISVLCEEHHFSGSLDDLMLIKNTFPNACILRKDFIQYPQEIEVSYRAGADMILLIVAMFIDEKTGFEQFSALYQECLSYGLTPLIEVHNTKEIDFIKPLNPTLVGINSRNLHTFEIDIPYACSLISLLPRNTKVIFESGIESDTLAYMIGSLGFDGLLCGGYLVAHSNPTQALQSLKTSILNARTQQPRFYQSIFAKMPYKKPLIKICGITRLDDALTIAEYPVDMFGFIMVEKSPRFIESKQIKHITKALKTLYPHILRIGVIDDNPKTLQNARNLLSEGHLDALQLHGINPTSPHYFGGIDLNKAHFCFYPVINIAQKDDLCNFVGAFCLLDSRSALGGGSGQSIDTEVLSSLKLQHLCIAGGINAQNLNDFLSLKPMMLDVNSGIESQPGRKDSQKIKEFFATLENLLPNHTTKHDIIADSQNLE
ncbi:bifunctional indole-3-glycerol phosphate synthase/phosphoribosylanthranilate isomerase [Helicobacter sp. MIT 05-5293]|uniref:bifunctional indole-3-glycerol phosphate synthase/phosphoribosylanthranilate isomerase n=1 Tax=Helicobacter sp. MIT 05-5293 TaxID=1548149 RepID=UPI00069113FB|nr:bifunctional indole-3-glycerol phosphate synthase/phosphoribosylanthranilate isomerase [Helicobacter sp. MIT 05-5293]TLD82320.1 bifunctional indole-3-glycerol phosphate synthase/phosphoribosylanthranilate isomerase [Helicobacter sp. MIT 05-5293]